MIKFLDIYNQDKRIHRKIIKKINILFKKNDFINGQNIEKFENNFKKYVKAKYAVACNSGTDALFIALKSLNLRANSEVIVPAMTYSATVFSVINAGFKPVLVDICKEKPTISPEKIRNKITKNTSAIILVHLYGECCDAKKIREIVKNKKIKIIEDAAQAHGAYDCSNCDNQYSNCCKKGEKAGQIGDSAGFSFYPGKNLGAYGDAGIVTFKNNKNCNYAKKLRNLGGVKKYEHEIIGINSRMDTLQSIILNEKLKYLEAQNKRRQSIANFYKKNILSKNIIKLNYSKGCVYHQYVIKSKKINKIIQLFKKNKISFGKHYPLPIHKIRAFRKYFIGEKYKNAEDIAKYGLSLPIHPNLKTSEIKKITKILNKI